MWFNNQPGNHCSENLFLRVRFWNNPNRKTILWGRDWWYTGNCHRCVDHSVVTKQMCFHLLYNEMRNIFKIRIQYMKTTYLFVMFEWNIGFIRQLRCYRIQSSSSEAFSLSCISLNISLGPRLCLVFNSSNRVLIFS